MRRRAAIAATIATLAVANPAEAEAAPRPMDEDEANRLVFSRREAEASLSEAAVDYYVRRYGVARDEARRRLATQTMVPNLHAPLAERLGERLSGLWFDNAEGEWVVDVNGAGAADPARAVLDRLGLDGAYRIEQVDFTRAQMLDAEARLIERLRGPMRAGQAQVAIGADRLDVTLAADAGANEREAARSALASFASGPGEPPGRLLTSEKQSLRYHEDLACAFPWCDTLVGGAAWLNDAYQRCTLGFKATRNGGLYFFTAGHCTGYPGSRWSSCRPGGWNCPAGGRVAGQYGSGGDGGLLDTSAGNWQSYAGYRTWSSGTTTALQGWKSQSAAVGTVTCLNGSTTGSTCGTVSASSASWGYQYAGMVQVSGACPHNGDSGGPWTNASSAIALGTHTASDEYQPVACTPETAVLEPIHRAVAWLGATPMTGAR